MGSQKRSFSPSPQQSLPALRHACAALKAAIELKGLDARGLDLNKLSDIADYFVIVSGTSERHVQGISDKIEDELRLLGEAPLCSNGYQSGEWVVLDYGNLIVHVFHEAVRQYYRFDELWHAAPEIELDDTFKQEARRLRTGLFRQTSITEP